MPSHPAFIHRARRASAVAAASTVVATSMAYAAGVVGAPASAPRAASAGIELVAADGGRPMFELSNLRSGDTASSCIAITNRSEVPVDVALRADKAGALDRFVRIRVQRGTPASTGARSCEGFAAESDLWTGTLADFPATDRPGIADGVLGAGATRAYRYTATLVGDDSVQGMTANAAFVFSGTGEPKPEPTPVPPAPAPAPASPPSDVPVPIATKPGESCATYYLAGGFKRTVRLAKRVRAQLKVTQTARGTAKEALRFQVGLKTLTGKTLINKGWANVAYKRNGKVVARSKKRPFTVVMKPSAFRTGFNRVQVVIRNRHGRSTRANFVLDFGKALLNSKTVCVIRGQANKRNP